MAKKIISKQRMKSFQACEGKGRTHASWLDGKCSNAMMDEDTAQVTPLEFTTTIMNAALDRGAMYKTGTVEGIELADGAGGQQVTGVKVDGAVISCSKVVVAYFKCRTVLCSSRIYFVLL